MHSLGIKEMADITVHNKTEYCTRHGYCYYQDVFTGGCHWFPGYDRIPALLMLLKTNSFDWIFWLGCDALITNMSIRLETIIDNNYGMIAATDGTELQMDSFLIQRARKGLELMERVWETRHETHGHYLEQSNLIKQSATPEFLGTVKLVPQKTMNSMRYGLYPDYQWNERFVKGIDCLGNSGEWSKGDFIFHVPGRPFQTKLAALREVEPFVVR